MSAHKDFPISLLNCLPSNCICSEISFACFLASFIVSATEVTHRILPPFVKTKITGNLLCRNGIITFIVDQGCSRVENNICKSFWWYFWKLSCLSSFQHKIIFENLWFQFPYLLIWDSQLMLAQLRKLSCATILFHMLTVFPGHRQW